VPLANTKTYFCDFPANWQPGHSAVARKCARWPSVFLCKLKAVGARQKQLLRAIKAAPAPARPFLTSKIEVCGQKIIKEAEKYI